MYFATTRSSCNISLIFMIYSLLHIRLMKKILDGEIELMRYKERIDFLENELRDKTADLIDAQRQIYLLKRTHNEEMMPKSDKPFIVSNALRVCNSLVLIYFMYMFLIKICKLVWIGMDLDCDG